MLAMITRLLPAILPPILLAVFSSLACAAGAGAESEAINRAGEQRMLSQRIVKSWVQIGLNVAPTMSKRQLDEAVRRFEDNLKVLDAAATSPDAKTALAGLRATWAPLRSSALGMISQGSATTLDARGEDVLMAAERLTLALQDQSGSASSRWVILAGRQRMLSQRLVKDYMLRQWGVDSARLRSDLESVQNEFTGALANLQQRSDNPPAVRAELDNLALQWEWLRAALAAEGAESFRLILAEGGDAVLELADNVTRLYQQSTP